ncbi:MAG: caspase family protein [Gammaproteobacteria bacterium]|nr:caspase family protein [Gammaproteobacteria bacterium]
MARKAFLLGCNSPGIQYCESDAALMASALKLRGYSVSEPADKGSKGCIIEKLDDFLGNVNDGDTLLFYFAGHTWKEGGKGLKLVLCGDSLEDPKKHLDAADNIISPLQERCKNNQKIIILDCCEAGKSIESISAADEFFRVLAAASRKGKARELTKKDLEELSAPAYLDDTLKDIRGAGFLTWHLYCALTSPSPDLVDENGCLGIDDLTRWLQDKAAAYNKKYQVKYGKTVELPEIYGRGVNITLADGLKSADRFGYPAALIRDLQKLLARHSLPAEQLTEIGRRCAQRDHQLQYPVCEPGDANCLIKHFKSYWHLPGSSLPFPLLHFVARIHEALGRPQELGNWLERCNTLLRARKFSARDIELSANLKLSGGSIETRDPPCLYIEAEPASRSAAQGARYELTCTYRNLWGEQEPAAVRSDAGLDEIKDLLEEALQKNKEIRAMFAPDAEYPPHLELILPYDCLTKNPERWNPPALGKTPLSARCRLTLRCRERIRKDNARHEDFCCNWKFFWQQNSACLAQKPVQLCQKPDPDWLQNSNDYKLYKYRRRLYQGIPLFALHAAPDKKKLADLLTAGAAMLLWPRHALSDAMKDSLCAFAPQKELAQLPDSLRLVHQELWEIATEGADEGCALQNLPYGLSLFWDDPDPRRRPGVIIKAGEEEESKHIDDTPLAFDYFSA